MGIKNILYLKEKALNNYHRRKDKFDKRIQVYKLRKRFFKLLEILCGSDTNFARLPEIDNLIDSGKAGLFLKHDVHGLSLKSLIEFASKEKSMNIVATYFFMTPEHPLTKKYYSFKEQIRAMRVIKELGHEVGL